MATEISTCEHCAKFNEKTQWCTSPELCPTQNEGLVIHKRGPFYRVGGTIFNDGKKARKQLDMNKRESERIIANGEEMEMARYGIRKIPHGYRVGDREYSSLKAAQLAARHLAAQMNEERVAQLIEEVRRELPMFTLRGDLHQMSEQKAFLEKQGFRVGQNDVYPGLYTREDYERAIVAIWENEVEGWLNYGSKDFPQHYIAIGYGKKKKQVMGGWEDKKPEKPAKPGKRDKYEAIKV